MSLMVMDKRNKETVREYTHRWKNKAMHVQPPLLEKEMVNLFANNFKSPYYEHLMGCSIQHFYDVVVIVERIEQRIRADIISEPPKKGGLLGRKMILK